MPAGVPPPSPPILRRLLSSATDSVGALPPPPAGSSLHAEEELELYRGLAVGVCAIGASFFLMDEVRRRAAYA